MSALGLSTPEIELPEVNMEEAAEGIAEALGQLIIDAEKLWAPRIHDALEEGDFTVYFGGFDKETKQVRCILTKDMGDAGKEAKAVAFWKAGQEEETRGKIADTAWDATLGPKVEDSISAQFDKEEWTKIPHKIKESAKEKAIDKVRELAKFDETVEGQIDAATEKMLKEAGFSDAPEASDAAASTKTAGGKNSTKKTSTETEPAKTFTRSDFKEIRMLGEGGTCTVQLVVEQATGLEYALKILRKTGHSREDDAQKDLYLRETSVLSLVKHHNILNLVSNFEEKNAFLIVTDYCKGGELFDRVIQGKFSERRASTLCLMMCLALEHCHDKNVIHRDIKPENYVFDTPEEDSNMKLIDFGYARQVPENQVVKDVCGSTYYVAPEVLKQHETRTGKTWKCSDMWSVGIIAFLMCTGRVPFNGPSEQDIANKIVRGTYKWPSSYKREAFHLSDEAKDFVDRILVPRPDKRLTAKEAMEHPWIKNNADVPDEPFPEHIISALKSFVESSKLKNAVARMLAKRMRPTDVEQVQRLFKKFDKDGNGRLDPQEMREMMREVHGAQNDEEADAMGKKLVSAVDDDGDGHLNVQELSTAVALGHAGKKEVIETTFHEFDEDGDGLISVDELRVGMNSFEYSYNVMMQMDDKRAQELISEVDKNGDGRIGMEEWIMAMQNEATRRQTAIDAGKN
jgi:calcium-dependent protein kinase